VEGERKVNPTWRPGSGEQISKHTGETQNGGLVQVNKINRNGSKEKMYKTQQANKYLT